MGRAQVRFLLLGWRREIYNTQTRFVLWVCLMSGVAKISHFYRADCVTFEGSDVQGAWRPNKGAAETNSSLHPRC